MSRVPLLLVGAGGHARACIDVIELDGRFAITGLLGLPVEVGMNVMGYPVVGTDDDLAAAASSAGSALIAVGQILNASPRQGLFARLEHIECTLPSVISPRAYVSRHATIGSGTIVMHGAVVNAGATVGRNCIVNSQALIEHDAIVGDHCHVATAAVVNGGVRIGTGSFVGSRAAIRQGVRIGDGCVIGMGLTVLTDCADGERRPQPRVA